MDSASIFTLLLLGGVSAKMALDVHGFFDCDGDVPGGDTVDLSNLEFDRDDAGNIILDGNLTFLRDVIDPWQWTLYSERLERGRWVTGMINRRVANFCPSFDSSFEAWHVFTKHMSQRKCPFKSGHAERFDMVNLGTFGIAIPAQFAGEWKFFFTGKIMKAESWEDDCIMARVTIFDT